MTCASPMSPTRRAQEVAIVDLRARRVVRRVPVGGPAGISRLDVLGRRLWVVLGSKSAEIAIVGLDHPRRPARGRPHPAAVPRPRRRLQPRGARVWVTSGDRGRIAIYDDHGTAAHPHTRGRRASATRDLPRRPRLRDERRRRRPARARARRAAAALGAGAGRLVQRRRGLRHWIFTPSLSRGTLCTFSARGAAIEQSAASRVRPTTPASSWSHERGPRGAATAVQSADGRRPRGARLRARGAARVRLGNRGALPAALAARLPRRLSRRARLGRSRGHRAGVLSRRHPQPRPLRPRPPVRAVAAPDRRQPRDRLDAGADAAAARASCWTSLPHRSSPARSTDRCSPRSRRCHPSIEP